MANQGITKSHKVDQIFAGGRDVKKHARGIRDQQPSMWPRTLVRCGPMGNDATPLGPRRALRNGDMDLVEVSDQGAPQRGGGFVASERTGRRDVQRSSCHLMDTDLRSGSYVQAVEQPLEAAAA